MMEAAATEKYFLLLLSLMVLSITVTECNPVADSIKCSRRTNKCEITNIYGEFPDRTTCRAQEVVYPTSEAELVTAVTSGLRSKQKMKVATRYTNSIPKLSCTDGDDGLLISTKFLNRILSKNSTDKTITVEGGARMKEVINAASEMGLAVPHSTSWWGVTIAGLISTGSHGSSLYDKGGALHEYVESIRMVTPGPDGAVIRQLNSSGSELDAAKISLGVLGVISQVTLKLQPNFKRSITIETKVDSNIASEVVGFGKKHEFATIYWYPHHRLVDYFVDDRVNLSVRGNGRFDYIRFRSIPRTASETERFNEARIETYSIPAEKCVISDSARVSITSAAYGLTNNGNNFRRFPVIGFQNKMESSGSCMDGPRNALFTTCAWDPRIDGLFMHQVSVSISLSKVEDFIKDVQKLRDISPEPFCGLELYTGILLRYVKASTAYLGEKDDVVKVDMTYYRSKNPMKPTINQHVFDEIEQMALIKYNGLPHWGKNRNLAFDGVIKKYERSPQFFKVKDEFDPEGLFSSEWTDKVLGIKGRTSIIRTGCAVDGLCICSKDSHCAPRRGYFCRPGKVYKDARVCQRSF
ncbi:UDP-N-acetylmuramate dehydrogenase [Zostera marina]|uniref:L-gulonolactone oxidase n=1 Tax=Zostera marina TaxID=29655 RepID=A0A0K9Q015_ZOSMR|nr:UDP-N-acetylmuramate dehydrogenase [Zostera marina]